MAASLKGSASIAGTGLTDFAGANGRTHLELMAQAAAAALRDAGLKPADVDGLYVNNFASPFLALQSAEYLGLDPRVLENTNIGGSSFVSYLRAAAMAIRTGQCEVALIAYGSTMRSSDNLGQRRGPGDVTPYESMYRPRNPMASYALAAQRHMYEFGHDPGTPGPRGRRRKKLGYEEPGCNPAGPPDGRGGAGPAHDL